MAKAFLIVDYNNVFPADRSSQEHIEFTLSFVIKQILEEYEIVDVVCVRIYAGFYKNAQLTARASQIFQKFSLMRLIPDTYGGRIIRGEVEFVSKLYGVDFEWLNTYREKDGPRIVVNNELERPYCLGNKEHCPVEILKKFTKSRDRICSTPGCSIQNNQIFKKYGQKMIDTMMTCDILSISDEPDTIMISVLSDDVDLYPAIVLSRCKNPDVIIRLYLHNNQHVDETNELNVYYNVKSVLLP